LARVVALGGEDCMVMSVFAGAVRVMMSGGYRRVWLGIRFLYAHDTVVNYSKHITSACEPGCSG
jgi:hypothetical protein